jgi:arylsulfatase A-like enzyme
LSSRPVIICRLAIMDIGRGEVQPRAIILALVMMTVSIGWSADEAAVGGKPVPPERVLFVVIDALRPDRIGANGYPLPTSPNIDQLVAEGVFFEECRSTSPWTKPSLASLFSGVGPQVHGVEKGGIRDSVAQRVPALPNGFETLADAFRRHGYATIAFTGNPHVRPETGLSRGFDRLEFTRQFGPGLAEDVIAWLDMPYPRDPALVKRYASHESNLATDWMPEAGPLTDEVEVSATAEGPRFEARERTGPLKCPVVTLADLPAGLDAVFGISFSASKGVSAWLAPGEEKVLPVHGNPRKVASDRVVIERLPAAGGELELKLCFAEPDSSFELGAVFVVPRVVLAEVRMTRWFAFLHLMNTHLPFRASPKHLELFEASAYGDRPMPLSAEAEASLGKQKIRGTNDFRDYQAHYDASIHEADAMLAAMLAHLEKQGLLDGTLVFVTADHGEELLDHGVMNHAAGPYDSLLRVPLIVYQKGALAPGVRVPGIVSLLDIYPTLVDLLDFETEAPMEGMSLVPYLYGEKAAVEGRAFVTSHTPMWSGSKARTQVVVRDGYKLMVWRNHHGEERVDLFDVEADPGETRNLAGDHPELVASLREFLTAECERQEALRQELGFLPDSNELDGETAAYLKDIGYLD